MFEVKSSDDLLRLVTEYMKLWDSGFDGTFELKVAPGNYRETGWNLEPAVDSRRRGEPATIDVVVRGEGVALPPPGRIRARSITLERTVLEPQGVMEMEVGAAFTMRGCAMINGRGSPGPLLRIKGRGQVDARPVPIDVAIEDSWFIRNYRGDWPSKTEGMISFDSAADAQAYFDRVAIRRSVFAGNAFAAELDLRYVRAADIEDSIFYKTWPDGVLLRCTTSEAVRVVDSVMVVEDAAHLVATGECPPVTVDRGSRIYVKAWTPGLKAPAGMLIDPAQMLDRKRFEPGEPVAAEAAGLPPGKLPPPELRARLRAAFHP